MHDRNIYRTIKSIKCCSNHTRLYVHNTYKVTPEDQISTLNPENVSMPLAISGGWKAGEPWLVRHVSSGAKGSSIYSNRQKNISETYHRNTKHIITLPRKHNTSMQHNANTPSPQHQ
jgi:hypothetical protein